MAPPTTSTIFLLFSLLILIVKSQPSDLESECANRWIYIKPLPPQFNLDLLSNCSEYQLFENFCPYIANHGLGQKTHNKSRSWYRTDPHMLEIIFHRRMLEYPCLTSDPNNADAVYLPYYAGIDALKYLYGPEVNSSFQHGIELFKLLTHPDSLAKYSVNTWVKNQGHDHFVVMARPAWDFTQPISNDPPTWGTSFLELPEFYNITALTLESRAYPWQEQAIPYPTSFHPPSLALFDMWLNRVRRSRRKTLMLFAAGGGISTSPNIRRSIRLECENSTGDSNKEYSNICEFVDCSNGICEHDPIRYMLPMLKSSFCLQPPGDTPTRRSTFDSILAGCIPVFFEELSAKKQFQWHLPEEKYDEFSVFIPKEEVVYKELKIVEVLMNIPKSEVKKKREKLMEIMLRVTYRKHGSSLGLRSKKDAFDIAIEGTLERIKARLKEVAVQ
ncbi:hypothetical protein LguiA_034170 [Lonicera macranthoides]